MGAWQAPLISIVLCFQSLWINKLKQVRKTKITVSRISELMASDHINTIVNRYCKAIKLIFVNQLKPFIKISENWHLVFLIFLLIGANTADIFSNTV